MPGAHGTIERASKRLGNGRAVLHARHRSRTHGERQAAHGSIGCSNQSGGTRATPARLGRALMRRASTAVRCYALGARRADAAPSTGAQYGVPLSSYATMYPLRHSRSALDLSRAAVFGADGALEISEQPAINRPATAASSSFFTTTSSTNLFGLEAQSVLKRLADRQAIIRPGAHPGHLMYSL